MVSSVTGTGSSASAQAMQKLMSEFRTKMKAADTDGTDGLSLEELSSIDTGDDQGAANFLSQLTQNFNKIDTDGNGQLSSNEMAAARPKKGHGHMGPPPGMMLEGLSSADTDGTEGLSKDELSSIDTSDDAGKANFVKNLTDNFDKLDTNKDGQLSEDEIKAGRPSGPPPTQQAASSTSSDSSGAGTSSDLSNNITSYLEKLLSNYQDNSSDSLMSNLDLAV